MKTLQHSQKGSVVEIVLIVIALVILAGVGYLVFAKSQDNTKESTTSSTAAEKTSASVDTQLVPTVATKLTSISDSKTNAGSSSYSPSTKPADSVLDFLPVTEWGIKIPTTMVGNSQLRLPLNYEMDSTLPDNSVASIRVFQGPSSGCTNSDRSVPFVYVLRDMQSNELDSSLPDKLDVSFEKNGHTYYIYKNLDSQGCVGDGSTVSQEEEILIDQLVQSSII